MNSMQTPIGMMPLNMLTSRSIEESSATETINQMQILCKERDELKVENMQLKQKVRDLNVYLDQREKRW